MPAKLKSQAQWIDIIKTQGCNSCHQLGNLATRRIEPELRKTFKTSVEAWARRVQSGQASEIMARNLGDIDAQRALTLFADWSDRIAAGELPKTKPASAARGRAQSGGDAVGLVRTQKLRP